MQYSLIINGQQFREYIKESGISEKTIQRNEKEVITWDGTSHYISIEKKSYDISLMKMSDIEWKILYGYLKLRIPALVTYSNVDTGTTVTNAEFYVKDISKDLDKTLGVETYISGISFTLEEK